MARVELRDIVTEDDVQAVMGLRRGPGDLVIRDAEPNGGRA
jgi:hypothetical protein